ncbi:translation machinery-associated protein 16 [Microplitis demolitor]|uniref:translation machinery-associated protein 16 n=1 Tax=Microplitis demolitor TaxID=69319 RepID=UPI0004CCFCFE|nr:translation machinery-associated protein 16 [Microplitis demolitor]
MSVVLKKGLSKQKKMLHPNSRKVTAIVKKSKKIEKREQSKQTGLMKQNLIREKMLWLKEHMKPQICPYTSELTGELLEKYIARHDEQLKGIAEKNKVRNKKNRSNASREDILRMSKERDLDEYNGCGIEIPNILNSTQCEMLRKWDGDVRYLPNFVFRRFGRRHVEQYKKILMTNASVDEKLPIQKDKENNQTKNDVKEKTEMDID